MLLNQSGSVLKNNVSFNYDSLNMRGSMKAENIYDFTIFKIENMIYELATSYAEHPDVYPLKLLLKMYINKEIEIYWEGGYPMVKSVNF